MHSIMRSRFPDLRHEVICSGEMLAAFLQKESWCGDSTPSARVVHGIANRSEERIRSTPRRFINACITDFSKVDKHGTANMMLLLDRPAGRARPWLNWIEHQTSDLRVGRSNRPGRTRKRANSSTRQSSGLLIRRLEVRFLLGPPHQDIPDHE